MHYYQFNIADYRKDTTHLSRLEHGIYRDLIDWYYLDEKCIPLETQSVMRRLRLATQEEAAALENVLSDFFVCEDGWRHHRIDQDIADYHLMADKNKANGTKGGRPKKTHSQPTGNPNQEPRTINQEPKEKTPSALRFDAQAHLVSIGVDPQAAADWLALRKQKKSAATKTAIDGIESEALKAGLSADSAIRECCQRGWAGFKASWMQSPQARAAPGYQSIHDKRADTIAILTGRKTNERTSTNEHDITGESFRVA